MIPRAVSTVVLMLVPLVAIGYLGLTSMQVGESPALEAAGLSGGQKLGKRYRSPTGKNGAKGDAEIYLLNWDYTGGHAGPTDTGKL